MFSKSQKYYDALYNAMGKDYSGEAETAHGMIQKYRRSKGIDLLDVACGTGHHAGYLSKYYRVTGMDLDTTMVAIARRNHPTIRFIRGDMIDFKQRGRFDAITCLFSSIGYVKTKKKLYKALRAMGDHLKEGGVLLVEPWFSPRQWAFGRPHVLHADAGDLKITRMSMGGKRRNISTLDFHYLVGTKQGVHYFKEHHELGLFTHAEYMHAFRAAGLHVIHNKKGLDGRGLYIGRTR